MCEKYWTLPTDSLLSSHSGCDVKNKDLPASQPSKPEQGIRFVGHKPGE